MVRIDDIMNLLDCNNSEEEQARGMKLAREVITKEVFLQPKTPYGQRVWENCAKVLCECPDAVLRQHLSGLLRWIADLDTPGARCVFERLQRYHQDSWFRNSRENCMKFAQALKNDAWERNLKALDRR